MLKTLRFKLMVQLTFTCAPKLGGGMLKSIGGKNMFGGRTGGLEYGARAGGLPYDCD